MENDRYNKLQRLHRQLNDVMREIQSLNDEHQEALLMEMESFVCIIEEAIRQIDHPPFRRNSTACLPPGRALRVNPGPGGIADIPKMPFNTPFKDWFREEVRRGIVYGSIADAAAGYEDAGYSFKQG